MQLKPDFAVAIVAAGRGERAGGDGPKQYRSLAGIPVIARTVQAFRDWQPDCRIVVVRHNDDEALLANALGDQLATVTAVPGGPSRQASVLCGLRALAESGRPPAHVLVHDAARPFVSPGLLDRMMAAITDDPEAGVIPGLPVTETLKKVGNGRLIDQTVPRNNLYRAQTPQAFPFARILELHERAASETEFEFTDDASLYEWAMMPVHVIEGDTRNLKLTYPDDFAEAERMLTSEPRDAIPDIRVGHGYDTHQLIAGDSVILCGVEIPHDRSLSGHSDADVGLHALTDALLATIGAGDIGSHFPPSDPQWKGASSDIFLDHAAALVRNAGGRITHCDVTIVCEAPRIGPHRDAMRKAVADTIGIDVGRVSVKATTNEKIGFVGRQEGIVALATATAVFPTQGDISDE
ncbi:bifunctional 2-C-methyl-D-erythritol 4-phosphate cytidylyltransferase/2-C-methyl-D-erythritol 2,4-cyclodiphosphate synthase [Oricola thermophila]|uniref:Bifunctional enzyme IspD/IspF n=1 Tax=Oricola thermophila TaxID=2742145 RepID=A0A6N1VGP7_9HYPH|nr:bifunctional 2-C-methyl-D-erythritol 4-phosphate cytidylyltransferase/2-C-methyl-D-erythritol 2,4-cyclodiphosphate synthase [Oricola thermophila]QKV18177.1 bifunctional 2-C-methyl-D-erythritol 4-phosphate cytidylyltransferase/2-C-methyl-D-erythritol 2,4-cyclodiphosphate synthase [Oricola thermophila]